MTIEEFNIMTFVTEMKARYKEDTFEIVSVDFEEKLIGLDMTGDDIISWVRCENVEIVE